MQVALAEGDDPPSAAELETWKEHMAHLPVLEAVRDVDAIHVTMTGFAHSNFTSEVYLADGPKNAFLKRRPGEPSVEDDLAAYRTMASVVLRFLDGYRRGDVSAHAWFELGAATNSVDPHVMTIERRAARTELAPTIDAFARFAGAHGFDALKARVAIERHSDPTYGLSDGDAILWAKQLDALGEHERAGAVLRWAAHLNPNSTDVLFALCDQVPAGDARRECFANLMLLDPTNSDARRETAVP
ncbi:MAG: hypothetical protein NTZ79_07115 [Proteobacteria bacterium]|nr:hypothetical protein [Pseudomonadota bacterium]